MTIEISEKEKAMITEALRWWADAHGSAGDDRLEFEAKDLIKRISLASMEEAK